MNSVKLQQILSIVANSTTITSKYSQKNISIVAYYLTAEKVEEYQLMESTRYTDVLTWPGSRELNSSELPS